MAKLIIKDDSWGSGFGFKNGEVYEILPSPEVINGKPATDEHKSYPWIMDPKRKEPVRLLRKEYDLLDE